MNEQRPILHQGWYPFLPSLHETGGFWYNIISYLKGLRNVGANQGKDKKGNSDKKDKGDPKKKKGNSGIKK